jgi:uncharacterized protein
MAMEIKFIESIAEINPASWNSLIGVDYPFLRHEFLLALENSSSVSKATGWQPQHVVASAHGELIGVIPLYLKTHSRGEYVFDNQWVQAYYQHGLSYYPKWVTSIPFTPCQGPRLVVQEKENKLSIVRMLLDFLKHSSEQSNISSWHCLFPDRQQMETLRTLGLNIREDVQFHWSNPGYRDFQEFLSTFNAKSRKKINRERRRCVEQGISLQRIPGPDITEFQWRTFYQFYLMTYRKRGMPAYLNIDFFLQLAETMPQQILMVFAVKNAAYVGAALSFIGSDTLYGRYWGCFEEYHSLHFETCYYQGLEYCIEHQLQRFDSGAQGEHKISRGFEPVTTYSAHWFKNRQFTLAVEDFLCREKQLVQQYKRDAQTLLPYKKSSPS